MFPTVQQFKALLVREDARKVACDCILAGFPAIYRDCPHVFDKLKAHLQRSLGLEGAEILVVGSARLGYSVCPGQFGAQFTPRSDVDVLIIDQGLFERIHEMTLHWYLPRHWSWDQIGAPERKWIRARQREVFMGWFEPTSLVTTDLLYAENVRELDSIRLRWFQAFKSLDLVTSTRCRCFDGRLYRNRACAELYHAHSLKKLKQEIMPQ